MCDINSILSRTGLPGHSAARDAAARNETAGRQNRWGVVLAGGDGRRLLGLTRLVSGDDRPKQFCSLFGGDTLLEQTRRRAERSIAADRILFPVTLSHRNFYVQESGIRHSQRIVQPANKGTAPPIVHSLLSIERQDSHAVIAILPSDHHYSDETAFTRALESAFETAARHPDSVVLLGSVANGPQTEYGWIETGTPINGVNGSFRVECFCEKPTLDLARRLFERGALWNTFVMIGHVRAFLNMVRATRNGLLKAFSHQHLWAGAEVQIPDWLYKQVYASDFSREILSIQTHRLIAQRLENVIWNDLGQPERVMEVLHAAGLQPWWMKEWRALRRPCGTAVPAASAAVA